MITIHLWINSTKNSHSPEPCLDTTGNPWPSLLAEVLRSWHATLRAALLLAIVVLLIVAMIVAKCVIAPFTSLDLPYQINLLRRTDRN